MPSTMAIRIQAAAGILFLIFCPFEVCVVGKRGALAGSLFLRQAKGIQEGPSRATGTAQRR
jgi:hypothetical protein